MDIISLGVDEAGGGGFLAYIIPAADADALGQHTKALQAEVVGAALLRQAGHDCSHPCIVLNAYQGAVPSALVHKVVPVETRPVHQGPCEGVGVRFGRVQRVDCVALRRGVRAAARAIL